MEYPTSHLYYFTSYTHGPVIENTWHYIIDALHDGKVGCDTVELH